jgi:hypothetical protein
VIGTCKIITVQSGNSFFRWRHRVTCQCHMSNITVSHASLQPAPCPPSFLNPNGTDDRRPLRCLSDLPLPLLLSLASHPPPPPLPPPSAAAAAAASSRASNQNVQRRTSLLIIKSPPASPNATTTAPVPPFAPAQTVEHALASITIHPSTPTGPLAAVECSFNI